MIVRQMVIKPGDDFKGFSEISKPHLILIFGILKELCDLKLIKKIKKLYPNAEIVGCSSSGEILDVNVIEFSLILTAIKFEKSRIRTEKVKITEKNSFEAGKKLVDNLIEDDLKHIFLLSEGINLNASELVKGLKMSLPPDVVITGGLSGDYGKFQESYTMLNTGPEADQVVAIGFYGEYLKIGYGSLGGWDEFGPERLITKSEGNVLYELDYRNALDLYKKYLGEHSAQLPASGLLFPLSIKRTKSENSTVRTILGIDEKNKSLVFAGDMPIGEYVKMNKANFDRLIDGSSNAAVSAFTALEKNVPELAILVSCVGRKMVLQQRIEEEVEAVRDVLGINTAICGFYSNGEISPFSDSVDCELHNQTMTITVFAEVTSNGERIS